MLNLRPEPFLDGPTHPRLVVGGQLSFTALLPGEPFFHAQKLPNSLEFCNT